MSLPPIIILGPRATDDSIRIWKAGIDAGWPVQRLPSWRIPSDFVRADRQILIYAEPLFAEAVADQLGIILLEPPPSWLPHLPHRFRHRHIYLSTLAEARLLQSSTFIKPAEGKTFEPGVRISGIGLPALGDLDETLPVLCSDPVTFTLEVRCFVRDRRVHTLSPYWRNDQLADGADGEWSFLDEEEQQACAFAQSVLSAPDVEVPPAFVLDIGLTKEHGWSVIEANPCWGAGLYGCSPSQAIEVMRGAFRDKHDMTSDDWNWTSPRIRQ